MVRSSMVLLVVGLLLTGCDDVFPSVRFVSVPPNLKDCSMNKLRSTAGDVYLVVRCPNSTTTATANPGSKHAATTITTER